MASTTHQARRQTELSGPTGLFLESGSAAVVGIEANLLRVVDGCLFGVLFIAPYFMGGRHPMGRFVYTALAVVAAVAWCARQAARGRGRFSCWPAAGVALLAFLVVAVQIVPLPEGMFACLAPATSAKLILWDSVAAPGHFPQWAQISLVPAATRAGLVALLTYSMLFIVTAERLRRMEDIERLLRWVAIAAVVMAGFGLLQYLTSNDKFLWVYEHPDRGTADSVKGSFANRNHFAHLMALGIGPLAVWTATSAGRRLPRRGSSFLSAEMLRALVPPVSLALTVLAGLITCSRGGALTTAVVVAITSLGLYRSRLIGCKSLVSIGCAGLFVVGGLWLAGFEKLATRLDDFAAGSVEELDRGQIRRKIWQANLAAVMDHPWLGAGVGSHSEVYPMYFDEPFPLELTHAENGYVQVASETGLAGIGLLAVGIALCATWCIGSLLRAASSQAIALATAVTAGLAASLVHSLVDFVWYIPGCIAVTLLLMACAFRLWRLTDPLASDKSASKPFGRQAWLGTTTVAALFGGWMVYGQFGPAIGSLYWDRYLRLSRSVGASTADNEAAAILAVRSIVPTLTEVVRWDPHHARAHRRLGAAYLLLFDDAQRTSPNPMDSSQVCEAAMAGGFRSRAELDAWLGRALGENKALLAVALAHVRRSLNLCPLQGQSYIDLGTLCFLEGGDPERKAECIQQALSVRPYDGYVLFKAGEAALLAGDHERALKAWDQSFNRGYEHRQRVIDLLAAQVPATYFLEHFSLDLDGLQKLCACYRRLDREDDYRAVLTPYAEKAVAAAKESTGDKDGRLWLDAHQAYRWLGNCELAELCAKKALESAPDHYDTRMALGEWRLESRDFQEAEAHFKWCLQRQPESQRLRDKLQKAMVGRLDGLSRISTARSENRNERSGPRNTTIR